MGILILDKFVTTLRLHWLWQECKAKSWVGMEIPCDEADRRLFIAAMAITIEDGNKAKLWTSRWLDGKAPQDIAPKILKLYKRKNRTVRKTLQDAHWVQDIDISDGFTIQHV